MTSRTYNRKSRITKKSLPEGELQEGRGGRGLGGELAWKGGKKDRKKGGETKPFRNEALDKRGT